MRFRLDAETDRMFREADRRLSWLRHTLLATAQHSRERSRSRHKRCYCLTAVLYSCRWLVSHSDVNGARSIQVARSRAGDCAQPPGCSLPRLGGRSAALWDVAAVLSLLPPYRYCRSRRPNLGIRLIVRHDRRQRN